MLLKLTSFVVSVLTIVVLAGGVLGETPVQKLIALRKRVQEMEKLLRSIHQITESRDDVIVKFDEFEKKWDQRIRLFKEALFHESGTYEKRRYAVDKFKRDNPQGANADARCLVIDGFMAEIRSRNEHNFVKTFLGQFPFELKDYIYIGGNNFEDLDEWVNPVTNTFVLASWARGYPTGTEAENCLSLDKKFGFDLSNMYCNDRFSRSMCEIPIP